MMEQRGETSYNLKFVVAFYGKSGIIAFVRKAPDHKIYGIIAQLG